MPHTAMHASKYAPSSRNRFKVILGDPGVPMLGQFCSRNIGVLVLSKSPLVNDSEIARLFEQAWRDPRLGQDSVENEYVF